jgi:hypothetical protein
MPTLRPEDPEVEVNMNRPAAGFLDSSSTVNENVRRRGATHAGAGRARLDGFAGPAVVRPL